MTRQEIFQKLKDVTAGWVFAVANRIDELKSYVNDWFSARRENASLEELKEVVEDWIFTKEAEIRQAQQTCLGITGKYIQCHEFCSSIPQDGTLISPDKLGGNWSLLNLNLGDVPCSFEIHEYQDERGKGFLLYARIKTILGKKHLKIYNFGPATELAQDWEEITDE